MPKREKRSEVERVYLRLVKLTNRGSKADSELLRQIAAWHLAAVRREVRWAKGRTVGHVFLKRECDESGEDCWFEIKGAMLDGPINVRMSQMIHDEVARVVLVPRRK